MEAFRDAAMMMIELRGFNPQKAADPLKPSVVTGGRPGYSMLQLYHSMCLRLIFDYLEREAERESNIYFF